MSDVNALLNDPRYNALTDDKKVEVLTKFYNKYIPQDSRYSTLTDEQKKKSYELFMQKYSPQTQTTPQQTVEQSPQIEAPYKPQPTQLSEYNEFGVPRLTQTQIDASLGDTRAQQRLSDIQKQKPTKQETQYMLRVAKSKELGEAKADWAGYGAMTAMAMLSTTGGGSLQNKDKGVVDEGRGYINDLVVSFGMNLLKAATSPADIFTTAKYRAKKIGFFEGASWATQEPNEPGKIIEAIKHGDIATVADIGARSAVASAPITMAWLASSLVGTYLSFQTSTTDKFINLSIERPEISRGKAALSATAAGVFEAAMEHVGNRLGIGRTMKMGKAMPANMFADMLKGKVAQTAAYKYFLSWMGEAASEGFEEVGSFALEYITDVLLGLQEWNSKEFYAGMIENFAAGTAAGGAQGAATAAFNYSGTRPFVNIESKLQKAAELKTSNITDPKERQTTETLRSIAKNTLDAIDAGKNNRGDTAITLAAENIKAIERAKSDNTYDSNFDSLLLYNSMIMDSALAAYSISEADETTSKIGYNLARQKERVKELQKEYKELRNAGHTSGDGTAEGARMSEIIEEIVPLAIDAYTQNEKKKTIEAEEGRKEAGITEAALEADLTPEPEVYPAPEPETHPEPTPTPEPETETKEPTTRDYVVSLIEKAKQTLDDADIAAAKKAAAEFSVQERTDEAMELRMQANELDTEKEKVKPQPQPQQVDDVDGMTWAELKDEAAAQKDRQDIIDKYGKYADMSHSELQDEAKKRGLKAGGKSTDIMARLKESDQAKPKAETTPAKPAAKKPFTTNEPTEQQQDRAIKESLIAEETPKKASKYESMGYNALQKEAKKHGINSFGVKKAELIRQIEEKAADTEKTKAERASVYDNSAEQKVSPTLSEDVKWKIYKARKQFERYVETPLAYRPSKKELDNALRKLNALESEYGVPNTLADGTRGGYAYEQKDATPIEYTGKSDGKIDRNLVDAIKSGEAWMHYNATTSEEWNIAISEMREEGSLWGIKDQDIIDQGTKIMEEIDKLLDEIENIDNTTKEYLDDLDESGTYISDEEIKEIVDENTKRIKEIEAKIKVLQEKHIDLWDNAKSDQSSQVPTPVKAAEDSKDQLGATKKAFDMSLSEYTDQYIAEHKYKDKYDAMGKLSLLEKQAETQWVSELKEHSKSGAMSDKAIDSYIQKYGREALFSTFRGVYEKGLSSWQPGIDKDAHNVTLTENELKLMSYSKITNYTETVGVGKYKGKIWRTAEYEALNDRGEIHKYEVKVDNDGIAKVKDKGKAKQQIEIEDAAQYKENPEQIRAWIDQNLPNINDYLKNKIAEFMLGGKKGDKKKLDHTALATVFTPNTRERLSEFSNLTMKLEIASMLKQIGDRVLSAEDSKAEGKKQPDTKPTVPQGVGADTKQTSGETPKDSGKPGQGRKIKPVKMSQAEYARQMHEALSGKLDAAQIDGIIAVMDAMMQTYADEMGITIDQAYVENVHSVDNAPIPEEKPSKPKQESPKDDGYIRINIGDLIEHYKAMGMDRQRAWKEYIQDTVLSKRVITDSIDAKDFMPFFDRIQFPQKSDKMMPKKQTADPVKAAEDSKAEGVEIDSNFDAADIEAGDARRNLPEVVVRRINTAWADNEKLTKDNKSKFRELWVSHGTNIEAYLDAMSRRGFTGKDQQAIIRWLNEARRLRMESEKRRAGYSAKAAEDSKSEVMSRSTFQEQYRQAQDGTARRSGARYQITDMPSAAEIAEAERQMAEVRAKYEGTDKWLKAPNGKPTKLTERQWLQVRTPNFKAWFGDWENDPKNASKVVDENGEPRVVWHGTENGGFTEFSKDKLGSNTGAPSARRGFFFAGKESTSTSVSYRGDGITETSSTLSSVIESVENLAFYATRMLSDIGATGYSDDYSEDLSFDIRHAAYKYSGDHKGYERAIISLLRNIEGDVGNNAKTIIEYGYSQTDIDDAIESLRHADDAIEGIRTDFSFGEPDETMYSVFLNVRNPIEHDYYGRERGISFDKMLSTAQEQGDDGAVFKNIRDGGMFDDIFVAFEPEQIKSATGNMGTYSQETANIFKQPGAISLDGIVQGYIEKRKDGTHHIGFLDPDVSTGLHEQAHLGRELLAKLAEKSPEWRRLYDAAEEWCGVENGVWTTEAEEKFARGFEKYVYEGHAPNAKLKTLYSRLKEWMRAIIDKLKELADIKLDKNILDVYDALFGGGIKKGVENKKLHVKNAFTVEQMKSTDPHKLTAALDKVGDNFGCIVDTKGLGSRASILMTDLETGKVIVSISRVADGYEVNGYHAANNGEAISRANDILGNVLRQEKQQTSPDIAEARRQMEEVRKQYEKPIAIDTVLKMAEEEFKTNPPEGFKYVRDLGESIARVETDNTIVLTEAFFGHSQKDRKEILYHEMAHRDTRELIKDHKKFWELVESGWFGHFDKEAMKWKGKFGGRNADEDITEAVAQYRMNPSAFESKHGKEMTDAVKELSGDFKTGYMKAPNGKPTKLTERQWLQVRTPNFKAWFGDWENDPKNASKVVDENGEPLVVYHGTPGQMHNEFHGGSRHYFSDNALVSEQYAGYNEDQIYDVYLNMKNPVIVDAEGKRYSSSKEFAKAERGADKADHDGAIIKNVDDSRWLLKGSTVFNGTTFIAISNTQIKSATDNVGTFDSTQPNILYQTKNKEMLTIHNISEDNLQQVIKQGGLPMPSLAVINTKETKHDEFGEISLIADPSIMDVSRKNPVYSQDAWTPTYPTVYHRVEESSMDNAKKIAEKINKRYKTKVYTYEIINDAQRQNYTGTIEEIITRIVHRSTNVGTFDDALKYARYLLKSHPLETREEIRVLNDKYGNARYRPNTAEEAVKVMRYEKNRTDKPIWESRELIGKIAPMFSSMAAVDKNRWRLMSKAARESAVESIDVDLQKIVKYSKEKRIEYRSYAATTDVANDIYDIAKGDMKYVRQRYAPDTDFSAFHEIIKKIKKIPTDMFESKPDRVVKLSEFAAAIVPYGTDYKTLKALKDAGINIAFYERGDMDDRHDKVVHEAEKSAILFQAQKSAPEGTVSVKTAAQRRAEAQETVIRSAAMLKSKLNKTNNVHEMTELMQKAVGTWIRLMYPGAAPLDGLEEYTMVADLSELDPDTKEYKALARKLARKRAADRKFRDAMLDNTGFSDTGDIPFENLYASLSAINPAAFDRVVKDESMDMLIDLIPGIKEAFGLKEGESIDLKLLQKIYDATFTSSPEVGDSKAVRPFRLPHRRLISAFGKAGQKLVDLGYKGTLKMAEYELLYSPKLRELHELIRSNQNNRGKKYDGDALKAISEAMMVINSKQDIADDQKLDAIKKSLKEWSEKNNEVINEKDIEGIYNVTRDILDMFRDFIVKFNQDPNHKKIGIREDYGDPRRYDWLRAAQTSIEGGVLLHAPGHVKQRTKDELSANYDSFSRDIYGNYLGYVQLMSKYMAFYDFAEYLKDRKMRYIKGNEAQEINLGSPMARDMTKAQIAAFEDSSMRKYIQDYAQGVIGIQRSGKKWDKRMSAWVNNVYSSALVFNVGLTLKNFNQRMLILSVVDPHVAGQVMKDYSFWKGLFKRDHEKYPTLSQIMQTYRDANDSLIADLVSESKRMSDGETNPISKLYYDWTALNGNLLRLSPFSVAELGNRAYGHAAGVYQIIMNSPDYKEARAKGMEVHEAMEHALSNNNTLREAAITYGGIINAEINADANPAFAPMFFNGASGINKIATFVRYGITLANLELRTFGSSSSMKSMLSPDMFKLWTSGEIKAASLSTKLQSAQIFYRALTDSNIAKLVEKSRMSSKDESDMLTTKQVKMVRELIGEQIEIVEKAIKGDYRHIVRGSKGKLIAELGLIGFAVAEAIIGFLHNIIVAMLPWWQKDSPLDDGIQIGLNDVLELSQTTSMFTDFRLGAGITPNLNAYYGSDKTTIKDAARWINRGTPFMGHVNQAIREATGKYGTDYIVDEIFDIME